MKIQIQHTDKTYRVDLSKPLDLSIPLDPAKAHPIAWYVNTVKIEPVRSKQFTGSIAEGGSVNFRNISFNPHGNGTHTECLGHITKKVHSINRSLRNYFTIAQLISISPKKGSNDPDFSSSSDRIITRSQLETVISSDIPQALILRTLPNTQDKRIKNWSNTNWPQLDFKAAQWMADIGIQHLLIDLPSVDREFDGGKLLSHHAFWRVPENPRWNATLTEMIFVDSNIPDGLYLLELQVAPFENDASPSRPVLYTLEKTDSKDPSHEH